MPQNKVIPSSHRDYKYPTDFQRTTPMRPRTDYTPSKADPNHFKTLNQINYQPNYFDSPQERVKKGYLL